MPRPFAFALMRWYQANARDLPWRRTHDPYKIWISEIMLQQTTVAAVVPYYQRWIHALPTVESVAQASLDRILKLWQGLGYYQRARNIHDAARRMVAQYSGKIPADAKHLKALPGFGPYTVGALLSIAFDQRQPIIDANIRRVVMRLDAICGQAVPRQDKKIVRFLDKVMPFRGIDVFNQAMMELGALVCLPQAPQCADCPVKKFCRSFKKNLQNRIPLFRKKKTEALNVVVALIRKNNKFFIQKRLEKGLLSGLWEFPGGKVDPGETMRQALDREIMEELGCRIQSARHLFKVRHAYTRFRVSVDVWACDMSRAPQTDPNHRWVDLKKINAFPLPAATVKIIRKIEEHNDAHSFDQ